MRCAWCRSGARNSPPKAASTSPASTIRLQPFIAKLSDAGIRVSLFIAADPRQIEMAAKLRAPVIEIHTGAWCDAVVDGHAAKAEAEWQRIAAGAKLARAAGLEVHAGHGLDYATAETIAALPEIAELNIGYYMIGEAIFVGIGETVRAMRAAMDARPPEAGKRGMIIGIGSDLIDITRVAKVIERHGDRFLDRIFTDAERAKAGAARQEREDGGGDLCQALCRQGGLFQGARNRDPARRLVAGYGGGEPAGRPADHAADRRGAGPAQALTPEGLRRGSTCRSPTIGRWRRPSS